MGAKWISKDALINTFEFKHQEISLQHGPHPMSGSLILVLHRFPIVLGLTRTITAHLPQLNSAPATKLQGENSDFWAAKLHDDVVTKDVFIGFELGTMVVKKPKTIGHLSVG